MKETRTRDFERIIKSAKQNVLSLAGQKRKFYDSALETGTSASGRRDKRKKAAFNFVSAGTYVKRGEIMRRKQVA